MNTVIYARYSSDKQTEASIEGQIKVCAEYATQHDFVVVGQYIDRAQSATTDNRPEFRRMVEDSGRGGFEVVLVYQLDRFARNRFDSAHYKHLLRKNGVRVVSARENISEDASGILMESVLEGMAEYYSAELSQKVRRGMALNAEKGLHNGGFTPLGYKVGGNRKLELDATTAPVVRLIYERYGSGQTVKQIIDYLNAKQYTTTAGKPFSKTSLGRILRNKKYVGVYEYKDTEIADAVPRIVSDELFYKVQEIMDKNQKAPARQRAREEYLLTTKLFCGHCRDMMTGFSGTSRNGVKHSYYACKTAKKKQCNKKSVQKDYIEDAVILAVRSQLTVENIAKIAKSVAALCQREKSSSEAGRLERMIKENDTQQKNLVDALKQGRAADILLAEIEKLAATKGELEGQLRQENAKSINLTEPEIVFFLEHLRDGKADDISYRRMLITVLVNKIYLYDDKFTVFVNTSEGTVEVTAALLDAVEKDNAECSPLDTFGEPKKRVLNR